MAWAVVTDDTFTRANTSAGAAGSTTGVGNGWIDAEGGIWSISGDALVGATSDIGGYTSGSLTRPANEALVDQRAVATTVGVPTAEAAIVLRTQGVGIYYLAVLEAPANTVAIFSIDAGTVTQLATGAVSPALAAGHNYSIDASAVGANPTSLALTVTDLSTGSAVASLTASDATAALQPAGTAGVLVWAPSSSPVTATFSRVTTYTDAAAPSGGITLSPSSVTAGTSGQVVNVTGSGASLSGATFTLSGGLGAAITAQAVQSATAATITISPGAVGGGNLTVTSSAGGSAALAVNPPNLGTLNLGFIGDSITAGTNGNPVAAMASYLTAQGYTVTATNRGISGTATTDWLPSGSNLPAAITAFQAAGVSIVQVMLATNDWRTGVTVAQHVANMRQIVAALRGAGFQVLLNKSPWAVPNGVVGQYVVPPDANERTRDAWKADIALCDGVNVLAGDTGAFEWTMLGNAALLDSYGLHPKDGPTNVTLGQYWAVAFLERYGALTNRWTHIGASSAPAFAVQ